VRREDVAFCVSTGYGREKIPFSDRNMSEISCHGKGAFWADRSVRTIIDVGGQDSKVIRVDSEGNLDDFVMNDKCAAGTGRFLEGVARILGVPVSELGPLSLKGKCKVPLSGICTVFTQFDILCFLAEGKNREDICMGVSEALAERIGRLASKVGVEDRVCITGGVAKNAGVVRALEKTLGRETVKTGVDPQIVGAIGAALFARKIFEEESQIERRADS
jgi:predicted CoA-substrate-specific enzyme activase